MGGKRTYHDTSEGHLARQEASDQKVCLPAKTKYNLAWSSRAIQQSLRAGAALSQQLVSLLLFGAQAVLHCLSPDITELRRVTTSRGCEMYPLPIHLAGAPCCDVAMMVILSGTPSD